MLASESLFVKDHLVPGIYRCNFLISNSSYSLCRSSDTRICAYREWVGVSCGIPLMDEYSLTVKILSTRAWKFSRNYVS